MGNYNSIDGFYRDVINSIVKGGLIAMEKAKEVAYQYINENWYSKYTNGLNDSTPNTYDRLGLMVDSLILDHEVKGSEIIFILKIKDDELHPTSNSWNESAMGYDRLYQFYSNNYGEQDILEYTQENFFEDGQVLNIISSSLKENGFDIN